MQHNRVSLCGEVVTAPFMRTQAGSYTVTSFKLAVTDPETPNRTDVHRVVCWSALAQFIEKNVKPGMLVTVDGTLRNRDIPSTRQQVTEVVAKRVQVERDGTHTDAPAHREPGRRADTAARGRRVAPPVRGNAA